MFQRYVHRKCWNGKGDARTAALFNEWVKYSQSNAMLLS